jgi:hypothetical protein
VGVEQQEVDDVRNKWTGLFESFEWPQFVKQIDQRQQPAGVNARPDPESEHKWI